MLEQEQELIPEFAGLIAGKLVELAKVAKINEEDEKIFTVTWGGDLMQVRTRFGGSNIELDQNIVRLGKGERLIFL